MDTLCTLGDTVMSSIGIMAVMLLTTIVGYAIGWRSGREEGYRIGFRVARTRYQASRRNNDLES